MVQAGTMKMANEVKISRNDWRHRGGLVMLWIHNNIGEDSYRIRFDESGLASDSKPITLIFDEDGQALLFKLAFPWEVLNANLYAQV